MEADGAKAAAEPIRASRDATTFMISSL